MSEHPAARAPFALAPPAEPGLGALVRAMAGSLRRYWDDAPGYLRLPYVVGAALIVCGLVHAVLWAVYGGPVAGPVSWRKPITFGVSFGMTTITLAWAGSYLPVRPRAGWILSVLLCASTTAEVVWVTVQHARGVPSHFNDATVLDDDLFTAGGVAIGVTNVVILTMTVAVFLRATAPRPLAWALRGGLIALLVAQGIGMWMILHGMDLQEAGVTPLSGPMTTYGPAGDMKFTHAVPMHAVQVLGALAWALSFTRLTTRARTVLVGLAVAGYAGLFVTALVRTSTGLAPFLPLGAPVLIYLIPVALLVTAWAATAVALYRGATA
ncbi:hypothetical protein [Spongiactinospora sp. TRM90649]|uniref:hypothetical protein n=1 Tax=Spongiactinospora sp. TRM90649 TaxID=3031114 RepID=UPI0023F69EEE|nr:hypothetical protein [Spongiactinospora sp. TRM90649]MDF5751613.1 hypothetical protein [Spongiactinospora sp. TRM90649]